jgi:hypothetical protein
MLTANGLFSKPPIIIGGCGRSGTSLLLSVLSAHPSILAIPDETMAFCPTAYGSETNLDAPFEMDRIQEKLRTLGTKHSATRWCEKTPKNILFFGRLLKTFGADVRLINIVRDGRDVLTSRHPNDPTRSWVNLNRWISDVGSGVPFDNHPQVLVVKYENLVLEFEKTMKMICGFLEEEVAPELLEWHQHTAVREHRAWGGKVKPLQTDSIGKWRRAEYAKMVAEMMSDIDAVRLLKRYGYISSCETLGVWKPNVLLRRLKKGIRAGVKKRVTARLKALVKCRLR